MMNALQSVLPRLFFGFVLLALAFSACTDPITVGSELLADDRATVAFTDELPFSSSTVMNDSVRIFDASARARTSRLFFGTVEDNIFGTVKREIGTSIRLGTATSGLVATPTFVENDSFVLDSLILILPYDTSSIYGNLFGTTMDYELYELDGVLSEDVDFNSSDEIPQISTLLASGSFSISREERLVADTLVDRDSVVVHHVRVSLPMSIVDRIAQSDSSNYETDSVFVENVLSGLVLRSTSSDNGFLSINLLNSEARLNAYFTKIDGSNASFYPFDLDVGVASYSFDRSGSLAGTLLESGSDNEISLVEGAGGLMTRIEIGGVSSLSDKIINQAALQFYLDASGGVDYAAFPAAPLVALYYRDADGRIQLIEDISSLPSGTSQANRQFFVGGDLETDESNDQFFYTTNFSIHLQGIVDGEYEPEIFIRVVPDETTPNRFVLRGPENSERPMTLKVAFTEF